MRLIAAALCLCLIAGFAQSASVTYKSGLRREFCSWGAQYWCSGTKTAALCGKRDWCISNHWNRHVIPDLSCSTGHDLIKHVRKVWASSDEKPTSEYEVAKLIATGCTIIKDQDARPLCKDIVTSHVHLPKLVELIDSKLSVQSVAEAIGVCKREAPKKVEQETDPESCITCEDVVTHAQKHAFRHFSLDVYKNMIKTQCDKLGSASKECHDIAMAKYKDFYHKLVHVEPSSVCKAQKRCVSKTGRLTPIKAKSEVCTTCEIVINDIRSMDRDQNVQAAVRGLLNQTCKYMLQFESLCSRMVDEGLEYVFEIIATELEPEVICQKLHLCGGVGLKADVKAESIENRPVNEKVSVNGVKCTLCEFMMREVDKMLLSNKTEEAIMKILDQVCTRLPATIAQQCETLLNQYKPQIVKLLAKELEPANVCTFLGICTQAMSAASKDVAQSDDGDCAICEFVVKVIDDLLRANETEDALEKLLDNICARLPPNVGKDCEKFIKLYSPQFLALLISKMRPEQICIMLKLCPSAPTVNNVAHEVQPKKMSQPVTDTELCELCEYLVDYIDKYLQKNSTEEEIEKLLDKICTVLPPTLTKNCESLVQQYGPFLIQLLAGGLDPKQACAEVGICKKQKVPEIKALNADSDVECAVCEMVMHQLDGLLGDKATAEEVKAALDHVCSLVPKSVQAQCTEYVNKYTAFILQAIVAEVQPKAVCSLLKLCPKSKMMTASNKAPEMTNLKDDECVVCKLAISALDSLLAANATKEDVKAAIEKVCTILPEGLRAQCNAFVSEYASYVVDIIVSDLKPEEVCQALGLCSSGKEKTKALSRKVNSGDETCTLCVMTFKALEDLLPQNATEEMIINLLRGQVCDRLGPKMKNQCKSMVSIYLPYVIDLIVMELPPQKICSTIQLCHNMTFAKSTAMSIAKRLKNDPGPVCIECEVLLSGLQRDLRTPGFETTAEAKLFSLCDRLPSDMSPTCRKLVHESLPDLLKLLSTYDPDTICALLGLCGKTKGVSTPLKDGAQCIICEFVLSELKSILTNNATEQQIEQAVEQVCNFLPASVKKDCVGFLHWYEPAVIQTLLSMKPDVVCTYIGLCSSKVKKSLAVPVNAGPQCVLCEFVITQLDSILSANATEAEITQAVEHVCNLLPSSVKRECDSLIAQYGPELIHLLVQHLKPSQICSALGLCSSKVSVKSGPQCTICEFVLKQLDTVLAKNATEKKIEEALDQVCNLLPTSIKAQCDDFVHQYAPVLVKALLKFAPDQVCTRLGLCSSKRLGVTPSLKDGPECTLCEFIMTELDNLLSDNATEKQIKQALDQVCNILPASVKDECDSFVQQYTPQLIQLLLQVKPSQVCSYLGLCSSKFTEVTSSVKAGPQCTICEFIMTEVDNILAGNATQQRIEQALDQVCNFLPASVKDECDSFVQQYTPELIQLLLQVKPDQVCTYLGLCTSKFEVKGSRVNAGPQCTICEYVMNQLDSMLADNATQAQIELALERVCNFLPSSVKEECDRFVQTYTPNLIQLLLQMKPAQVCSYLGLCSSEVNVKAGPTCVLCEFVMTQLDSILASNATQQQIQQALEQVCNLLPATVKQECDGFVKLYTPTLIQLLLQVKPEQVCTTLKLCSNKISDFRVQNSVKEAVQCTLCKFVMEQLDKMLEDNATQKQIEQALEQVCDALPENIRPECKTFMDLYIPRLLEILLTYKPQNVCAALAICPNNTISASQSQPLKASAGCVVCEAIVKEFENVVGTNATKGKVEAFIDQACSLVPSNLKEQCDQLVATFTPEVLDLLLEIKPDQWCSAIQVCQAKNALVSVPVKDGPQCTICEYAMNQLDQILAKNSTEQQIEQALDKVCSLLPATVQQECHAFVKQYAPELVQLLLQYPPKQVCTMLGLCSNEISASESVKDGPQCIICEFAMSQLDHMLAQNASQQQVEQALDKVCTILPKTVKQECDAFVKQYFKQIVVIVLQYKPHQICALLKLCPSKNQVGLPVTSISKPNIGCIICDFVMVQVEEIMTEKPTEDKIKEVLEHACTAFPYEDWKAECTELVDKYTAEIVELLLVLKPKDICISLKLCPNNTAAQTLKVNDGPQCTICEFVMTQLDNMLSDNATQAQIEAALEQVCNFLPASIKAECDTLVQQYSPQLIQLLLQFKPSEVCTRLGLCTSKSRAQTLKVNDGPQCTLCEFAMTQIDNMLSDNATQAQIEAALEQVCNFLPASIKAECDMLVQQYSPQLIQLLLQFKPSEVCTRLGLCTSKSRAQTLKVNDGPQCTLCEFAMTQIDNMLSDNATQAQIEAALEQVCNFLPASIKAECDTLVQQYSPQLIQLLLQFKPSEVCTRLGLCTSKSRAQTLKVNDGPQCTLCEFAMTQIDNMLSDNATQAQIEAALEQVCNFLPASIKAECDMLVQQYSPQLIQLLLQFKPSEVCTRLGLCTSKSRAQTLKVNDGPQCTLCEFAMTQIDNMLSDNATQAQIEAALEQVCNFLPASIKAECDTLVQQYSPQLIQLLLQFKPSEVCTRLGLCTSKSRAQTLKVNDGPQCTLCEFAMTQIDNMLSDNATQAQIEAALEQVCNFLPASVKAECDTLVQQYSPQLIQLLLQFKPSEVCIRLGLCTSKSRAQTLKVNDGPQCTICEFAVTQLDNMLSDNATQSQIEAALEQVCNFLPASVKAECDTLVQQYTPQLIQLLLQFKPSEVCTRLGLCTSKSRAQTLKVNDGPQCTLCEFAMTQIDNMLSDNATQAQIEAALEQVCNFLPASIKAECDTLVQQYTPQLIQLLLQFKPSEVCTRLGLCTSKSRAQTLKVNDGPQCTLCEFAMTQIDNMLSDNATQAQIEAALEQVCNFLPASVKAECDTLVQQYTPQLIQLLLQFKPSEVCTRLGLCTSKSRAQTLKVNDGPQCTICEFAMTQLDNMLSDNATQAQIEAALEQVCNFLPSSVKAECDTLVQQYTPQLIQLLLQFKPSEVCTRLGLCTNKAVSKPVRNGPVCVICEFVLLEMDNLLSENATQVQIEMALEIVCNILPETVRHECALLVEQFTPQLVHFLLHYKPDQVCTLMGLCTSRSSVALKQSAQDGPQCILCEFIMRELEKRLAANATEAQITAALEQVCNFLPTSLKQDCDNFVQQYLPKLIGLLVQDVKPKQVCTYLGVCSSFKKAEGIKAVVGQIKAAVGNSDLCDFCEYVIQYVDDAMKENITKEEIEVVVHKICSFVPADLQDFCDQFLEMQAENLIKHLAETLDPKGLCLSAGLCTDPSRQGVSSGQNVKPARICEICERITHDLDLLLQQDFTEEALKYGLHEVCKTLDSKAQKTCDKFVTKYTHVFIQVALTVPPEQICIVLQMCPPAPAPSIADQSNDLQFVPESEQSSSAVDRPIEYHPYCSTCKFLVYYLQTSITNSFWKDTSKNSMYQFCLQLKYEQDVCKLLMDMNADHILGTVRGFDFPMGFCQKMDLCEPPYNDDDSEAEHALSKTMMNQLAVPSADYPYCSSCKWLMSELNGVVEQPFWRTQVRTSLDVTCDLMTNGNDVCKRIVSQNIEHIITTVGSSGWPDQFCQAIDLCAIPSKKIQSKSAIACDICEKISTTAHIFLKTGASSKTVANYLEMACGTAMDDVEKDRCLTIVKQYTPSLLDVLKTEEDPKAACKAVDLCLAP